MGNRMFGYPGQAGEKSMKRMMKSRSGYFVGYYQWKNWEKAR